MPNNYVLLERIELNASAASVTFANIPQTGYTDLKVVVSARGDYSGGTIAFRLNPNASTTNMTSKVLYGDGSSAASFSDTIAYGNIPGNTATANTFGNLEFYIPNYGSANAKSISCDGVTENNATAALALFSASLWNSSTAISSLQMLTTVGNLMAGSTFSLYALAATGTTPAIAPKASGGNVIATDGTYWYHAFLANGTFTPQVGLTADCLVIAGGGGGGATQAGGGGAGGLLPFTSQSISTAQTVTVGAGGAGSSTSARGVNGSDSQLGALTLVKGGGGGGSFSDPASGNNTGADGGSGGGGGTAGQASGSWAGGAASPSGQGNAGGSGQLVAGTWRNGGGGGGASAAGVNAAASAPSGTGGAGSSSYSSYGSATNTGQNVSGTYWYAGGGGGGGNTAGVGGNGGGGRGGDASAGANGTANTGGGGGGGGYSGTANGYIGGAGIVIIRYAI